MRLEYPKLRPTGNEWEEREESSVLSENNDSAPASEAEDATGEEDAAESEDACDSQDDREIKGKDKEGWISNGWAELRQRSGVVSL